MTKLTNRENVLFQDYSTRRERMGASRTERALTAFIGIIVLAVLGLEIGVAIASHLYV